jgi:hypothetical protein
VLCGDIMNNTQCSSASSDIEGACSWIYASNNNSNTSGVCVPISSQSVNCAYINRSGQCESGAGITSISSSCVWIYGTSNEGDSSGSCLAKSDENVGCEDIHRQSQCANGGGITALSNKCGIYNNVCKVLCSLLSESVCKMTARFDDCWWLEKNGSVYSGGCVNRV